MAQQFQGVVQFFNQDGELTAVVDAGEDSEPGGQVRVLNTKGTTTVHVDGRSLGTISVRDGDGTEMLRLDASGANLFVGSKDAAKPKSGLISVRNHTGDIAASLSGATFPEQKATLSLGTGSTAKAGNAGQILLRDSAGAETFRLEGKGSQLMVRDGQGNIKLVLDGAKGSIGIRTFSPSRALHVEGEEIHSGGAGGGFSFGDRQSTGFVNGPTNGERWVLYASGGSARLWSGTDKVVFTKDGDIQLTGGDCAEEFEVVDPHIEPGSVVVLNDTGTLEASTIDYDERVIGVVSGAGTHKPGLVLDRQEGKQSRRPVALMGKAFCKVDARPAPVRTGDLLTTGGAPGHAMRVTDRGRALGSVVGKALQPLDGGTGLIAVLVTLQ